MRGELRAPALRTTSPASALRLAGMDELDPDRAAAVEDDPGHERIRADRKVGSTLGGIKERGRRAGSASVSDGELAGTDAALLDTVVIRVVGKPDLLERLDDRLGQRSELKRLGHLERPARSVQGLGENVVPLHRQEVGKEIGERPGSGVADRRLPLVVITHLTAHVHHGVHGAAAAQATALQEGYLPTAELPLRNCRVGIHELAVLKELGETGRDVDQRREVTTAIFKDEHFGVRLGRKPAGDKAARGAGAHHDHIESRRSSF